MDNIKILKNYILYFLLMILVCLIGITDVLAWDWTNANGITYTAIGYVTNDTQIQIEVTYNTSSGAPLPVAVDQTVNTEIKTLYINLSNYTFLANTRYELELNLPNNKLVYANTYSVQGYNGEQCMISLSDSEFNSEYSRFDFQCPSATNSIAISVYNSNNTAITQSGIFSWHYSHLYSSTMPINSSTTNNNDLINNANQNADRIIDNQNQNTQQQIESQKSCIQIDKSNTIQNGFLMSNGNIDTTNSNYGITDYINIYKSEVKLLQQMTSTSTYTCFYNTNKELIQCKINSNLGTINDNITLPNNVYYMRTSIHYSQNKPQFEVCKNGNQAISDSVNGLNDSITDDSPVDMSSLGDTLGWLPAGPIDSILNLPINMLNGLNTALNGTCSPLSINVPYINTNVSIPCVSTIFANITGLSNFWNWVGAIASVVILYRYLLSLWNYYDRLTTMQVNFRDDFGGGV